MAFLDRLFGRGKASGAQQPATEYDSFHMQPEPHRDEQALQRYRYMLRTAPPEAIEQAHAEAFARLTPAQRAQVLRELTAKLPPHEQVAATLDQDDPQTLARLATRAELRQPGMLERTFGGMSGGMLAGTIFGSLVAGFVGSVIAQQFFDSVGGDAGLAEGDVGEQAGNDPGGFGDDFGGSADFGDVI
jgi:hypothetical protein